MTVATTTRKMTPQAMDGVTLDFNFSFRALTTDAETIKAFITDGSGVNTDLVYGDSGINGYTVSVNSNGVGGTITVVNARTSDYTITIYREIGITQGSDYNDRNSFPAETLESNLDKLTMIAQEIDEEISRSIKVDINSSIDATLPTPSAGKALLWNATADGLENSTDDFNNIVTDAAAQAVIATTQAGIATTQAGLANTARIAAQTAQTNAEAWASKTDGQVEATDYSSKAYAIGGTGVTSVIGSSKEWATTAEDTEVTTGLYSALHYAAKASASATAAEVAKIEWQGSWSAGSYDESDAVEHNGSSWIATTTTTEEPSITATDWDLLALRGTDGTGSGDVSSSISSSTDNAVAVFDGVDGKTIKQGTAGTDYAGISTAQSFTKAQRGDVVSLTYSSTITADFSLANHFETVLTGNTTFALPTNLVEGQDGYIRIIQDTTGSRTAAYAWCWAFAGGTAPVLSTAGASRDDLYYSVKMYKTSTVTISIATPGVVSWTGHGLITGQKIIFTTDGALPTGITAGTAYYVINVDADTFRIATSLSNAAAGTAINTSGSQSGTHTATAATIAASLQKGVI